MSEKSVCCIHRVDCTYPFCPNDGSCIGYFGVSKMGYREIVGSYKGFVRNPNQYQIEKTVKKHRKLNKSVKNSRQNILRNRKNLEKGITV